MASQMVIPASNDTLFIRGFSSRHHIDDIRDYFTREGGRNSVEFFKENNTGDGLFIALKFESKSNARDIFNRLDGVEVMGDRLSISWYKDVRKARSYGDNVGGPFRQRPHNQQWGQDRYDYRGPNNYNRGRPGQYNNRGSGQRQGGWYNRGDYSNDGSGRSRRFTRSSSHSRSRSASPRSRSRSYSRSSSRDDHRDSRSRSAESRERTRKRQRSTSDGSRRRSAGRKGKARDSSSTSRSAELEDLGSHSESGSATPPPRSEKISKKVKGALKKDSTTAGSEVAASGAKSKDNSANMSQDFEESDINEFSLEDVASPQPVSAPLTSSSKSTRAVRSAISTVDKPTTAGKRQSSQKITSIDDAIEAANMPVNELSPQPAVTKKQFASENAGKVKKQKADRRMYEDPISDEDDQITEKLPAGWNKAGVRDSEERVKRIPKDHVNNLSDPTDSVNYPFDEPPSKRNVTTVPKKVERNVQKEFDPFDDEDDMEDMEQAVVKTRGRRLGDAEETLGRQAGGTREDKSRRAAVTAVTTGLSSATKRAATSRVTGVLGLSHDKMLLVRQKKDEIEKAYRQDCETFATVTKMLINKEPSLEDKIQDSLRENLKEIGQRCIQELREFIERLREEDEPDTSL